MLLCGCVGGSGSKTSPSYAVDIKTEQLYSQLAVTPNQLHAGFAIDPDSLSFPPLSETALRGFLAKQPAVTEFNQLASQTSRLCQWCLDKRKERCKS